MRTTLQRIVAPALGVLRSYRGTTLLLAATGAAMLAALLPIGALVSPSGAGFLSRLGLPPLPVTDIGVNLGPAAQGPAELRQIALTLLVRLLLGVGAGLLGVGWLTVLAVGVARAVARGPEIRVRRAVGASRRHLLVGELFGSTVIAAAALGVGGLAGRYGARAALAAWPGTVAAGGQAAGVVAAVLVVAGILAGGMAPLAFARRASPVRDAGTAALGLVVPVTQLGLSLTVLAAAALLQRGAARVISTGGAAPGRGDVYQITTRDSTDEQRAAAYAALLDRLRADSLTVSLTSPGTITGLGPVNTVGTDCGPCRWAGGALYLPWHTFAATHYLVSADTFRALAIPTIAGRGISASDRWFSPRVAVVNRTLALRHYHDGQALGRAIAIGHGPGALYTVVGIVGDRTPVGFGGPLEPDEQVYLSVLQHPSRSVDLLIRAAAGPGVLERVGGTVREMVGRQGAKVALTSEAALLAAEAAPLRWFRVMIGGEGWAMLAVATIGTFATLWLWVTSLLPELGLRRSVGARRRDVLGYVAARAAVVAAAGAAFGCWAGMMAWDAMRAVVTGLPAWDFEAVLRFALLLAFAALAGAVLPAWRAVRAAPAALVAA